MSRRVRIPRLFHEFFGEEASLADLLITCFAVIGVAIVIVLRPAARPVATAWWEIALVSLVGADLAGGAVAGFTTGTDAYYAARPKLRLAFPALHVLHPAILFFVIGGPPEVWIVIPAFAIVSAYVVNALARELQPVAAAALTTAGVVICFSWFVVAPPALWFGPLFLVKLVLGFAVRRSLPATTSDGSDSAAPKPRLHKSVD